MLTPTPIPGVLILACHNAPDNGLPVYISLEWYNRTLAAPNAGIITRDAITAPNTLSL